MRRSVSAMIFIGIVRGCPLTRIAQRVLDVPYAIDDTVAADVAMPEDVYA